MLPSLELRASVRETLHRPFIDLLQLPIRPDPGGGKLKHLQIQELSTLAEPLTHELVQRAVGSVA